MGLYHLFGIFWTTQFIAGFGVMITAGAIAAFYWQRDDMPRGPIRKAMKRTARYHLGSIALGSFIVAVVQFVRAIMEYVNKKTKKAQDTNPIVKLFMCCIKYCLWYLEKVLKYINRNAYILVAVKGYSYCYSAVEAIKLIILNMMRIAAVNTVGDFLTWLGNWSSPACAVSPRFSCAIWTPTPTRIRRRTSRRPSSPSSSAPSSGTSRRTCSSPCTRWRWTPSSSLSADCGTAGGPHFAPPLLMSALGKGTSSKVDSE